MDRSSMQYVMKIKVPALNIETYMRAENNEIMVGREVDNDIVLSADFISRHHGKFIWNEDGLLFEDNSTNGTFLVYPERWVQLPKTISEKIPDSGTLRLGPEDEENLDLHYESNDFRSSIFSAAVAHQHAGELEQAKKLFHLLTTLYTDFPEPYQHEAFVLERLGQAKEAIARYEESIRVGGSSRKVAANLARLLEENGDPVEAFHWYQKLYQSDPTNSMAKQKIKALLPQLEERIEDIQRKTWRIHDFLELTAKTKHFSIKINNSKHHARRLSTKLVDMSNILEDEAYPKIGEKLGQYPKEVTDVRLFGDMDDFYLQKGFDALQHGNFDLDGLYDLSEMSVILPRTKSLSLHKIRKTLLHEYTHRLLCFGQTPKASLPRWLHEGLSEVCPASSHIEILKEPATAIETRGIESLSDLERLIKDFDQEAYRLFTQISARVVAYLVDRSDWKGMRGLLDDLRKGKNIEKALGKLGESGQDLVAKALRYGSKKEWDPNGTDTKRYGGERGSL